jgi:hypothetical protein
MRKLKSDRIIPILIASILAIIVIGSATGNFTLSRQLEPAVFADANDVVYVAIWKPGAYLELTSPDGKKMIIESVDPRPWPNNRLVAKVRFDGTVEYVRPVSYPQSPCDDRLPTNHVKVTGSLVGAAVDGTWTIKNPFGGNGGLDSPTGVRLEIKGKIFDDVWGAAGFSPIEATTFPCGNGELAGRSDELIKNWNWHMTGSLPYKTQNKIPTLSSEENPANSRYFTSVSIPAPTVFADSSDVIYVALGHLGDSATIMAPDGKQMTLTFSAITSSSDDVGNFALDTLFHAQHNALPIIAKVRLNGDVEYVRYTYDCGLTFNKDAVLTSGNLVGAAVDGTWIIKNGHFIGPSGSRLEIQGKVFDDVHAVTEEIYECGSAILAGQGVWGGYVSLWNWHMQTVERYDSYIHSCPLLECASPTYNSKFNAEEFPANAKFFIVPPITVITCDTFVSAESSLTNPQASVQTGVEITINGTKYSSCINKSVRVFNSVFNEGFEDGQIQPLETDAISGWETTAQVHNGGSFSARSGEISDDEQTTLALNINLHSAGSISFARKTSTEKGYDFLRFYIDGIKLGEWSGEKDWALSTHLLSPGRHLLTWSYEKDASRSEGQDAVWIDDVSINSAGPIQRTTCGITSASSSNSNTVGSNCQVETTYGNYTLHQNYTACTSNCNAQNPNSIVIDTWISSSGIPIGTHRTRLCASTDPLIMTGCLHDSDGDGDLLLQEVFMCTDPTNPESNRRSYPSQQLPGGGTQYTVPNYPFGCELPFMYATAAKQFIQNLIFGP